MASIIGLRKRKPSADISHDNSASTSTTSFSSALQNIEAQTLNSVKHIKTVSDTTTLTPEDSVEPSPKTSEEVPRHNFETSKPLQSLPHHESYDKASTTTRTVQKIRPVVTNTTEITPSIIDHPSRATPEQTLITTIASSHSLPVTCIRTPVSPSPCPGSSPPRTHLHTKITSVTAQLNTVQSDLSSAYTKLRSHLRRDSGNTGNKENQPPRNPKASRRRTSDASIASVSKISNSEDENEKTNESENAKDSAENDKATAKTAQGIVNRHIRQLAQYNELKDTALGLMGLIAQERGVLMGNVTKEFGVGAVAAEA